MRMTATDINYDEDVVRWEPDSRERLEQAAMALYAERGFDNTTVAEIAARAGLTERTFFRHFTDKREVLFAGAGQLQEAMVRAVAGAPASASPLDAVTAGVEAAGARLPGPVAARRRNAIIVANAELRERELIKLASLSAALADTLRDRGVEAALSDLIAEIGIGVFKIAFERWIDESNERSFPELVGESLDQLRAVSAGR